MCRGIPRVFIIKPAMIPRRAPGRHRHGALSLEYRRRKGLYGGLRRNDVNTLIKMRRKNRPISARLWL
jgi:hypothetical protein